jgi:hypothetical protein
MKSTAENPARRAASDRNEIGGVNQHAKQRIECLQRCAWKQPSQEMVERLVAAKKAD